MSPFREALRAHARREENRRWLFVPYDQLTDAVGPLSRERAEDVGIVLVECPDKAGRRPYHQQKLALLLANLRHFAVEQAARGVAVRHVVASYAAALARLAPELGEIAMMRPAERELRAELAPLVEAKKLAVLPHEGWLTTRDDFRQSHAGPPWRMDAFYKHVRRRTGILMEAGKPVGGKFSFDTENRKPWRGKPRAPSPPTFTPDAITSEVCDWVAEKLAHHPGRITPSRIPASRADAERAWAWAKDECLPFFGPFEDAMATDARGLFHTQISSLLNLQRLSAHRVVADVAAMKHVPLPSREGFIRQILGWREYMRHVHEATDGFRIVAGVPQPSAARPGDGGYAGWRGEAWPASRGGDGGSLASFVGAARAVPPAYWGTPSGLNCLDTVVRAVWEDGYSHHITRLMVLSNIAMLLDLSPRELTDWFWVAYVDAYDWVVEPNVHGMGTFGVGDLLTTKPYIAGSAYIDRMSDFCEHCRFDPKTTCPFPSMYWAYLGRHADALANVPRLRLPLVAESRRTAAQRRADAATFAAVSATLAAGRPLEPR